MQQFAKMMNFRELVGLRFDRRSIIRVRLYDMRASERRNTLVHRDDMLAKKFPVFDGNILLFIHISQ
jgi:hypothetical protein